MADDRALLCCSFNQDRSCFSVGTSEGYKIFNCDTCSCVYEKLDGAVNLIEMFFTTSLLALVGAGKQPELSPRRLFILNTATQVKRAVDFVSSVLAVRWNKKRIVIVLDRKVHINELPHLNCLQILDTAENRKGVCAFSSNTENCYLALPASSTTGTVFVYDTLHLNALGEFQAHKSPLAAMAFTPDGLLLATASDHGTVIRVHVIPQASKAFTFRRGSYAATIYSLSFGPQSLSPQLLAATSSSGTLHVFRLCSPPARQGTNKRVSDLLAAVIPETVSDIVEPDLHFATVRHGFSPGVKSICAIAAPLEEELPSSSSADRARIFVVTLNGFFNEYQVSGTPNGGVCSLERECSLMTTGSDQISARFV
ncbi:autophagy-related protein 18b isoform X1 [Selaginella moellendorffii]|uniref:autophagy-related protein 18b isoform X1 n=2 Tax=Selaginella moellendorffii TaxID=88036 RepID=UPI000D1C4870|nr:autophagy-related protein 18b isoform X1 [Selaginella moellendorffii]|eukprot:XP_024540257.1 autophagy-related protein 18b isoform X1 [Selaginella moellendorffii]